MRHRFLAAFSGVGISLGLAILLSPVEATYPGPGPTVGCSGSTNELAFGGQCVAVQGPSAPTQPATFHPWLVGLPTAPPACTPHEVTEWATGIATDSWSWTGSFWTLGGQRVPVLRSTPLEDTGWVWEVYCGPGAGIRYLGYQQLPRRPDPCSLGTPAASCLPGYSPGSFRAAVEGKVPAEQILATPPHSGLVGVPVNLELSPAPVMEQAIINDTVPDLGDGDLGEGIHVEWIVQAVPQGVVWTHPDGTSSTSSSWIPQVEEQLGYLVATVSYSVQAFGFWSNGVNVYQLPPQDVGTIRVTARLPYGIQQVQSNLG
jgi:hypothetical protein